jgi:hypothetical protein
MFACGGVVRSLPAGCTPPPPLTGTVVPSKPILHEEFSLTAFTTSDEKPSPPSLARLPLSQFGRGDWGVRAIYRGECHHNVKP